MVGRSEDMFDPIPPQEVTELSTGEGCCIVGPTTSGKPRDANDRRSNSIVAADVDVFVTKMSNHRE